MKTPLYSYTVVHGWGRSFVIEHAEIMAPPGPLRYVSSRAILKYTDPHHQAEAILAAADLRRSEATRRALETQAPARVAIVRHTIIRGLADGD